MDASAIVDDECNFFAGLPFALYLFSREYFNTSMLVYIDPSESPCVLGEFDIDRGKQVRSHNVP